MRRELELPPGDDLAGGCPGGGLPELGPYGQPGLASTGGAQRLGG